MRHSYRLQIYRVTFTNYERGQSNKTSSITIWYHSSLLKEKKKEKEKKQKAQEEKSPSHSYRNRFPRISPKSIAVKQSKFSTVSDTILSEQGRCSINRMVKRF